MHRCLQIVMLETIEQLRFRLKFSSEFNFIQKTQKLTSITVSKIVSTRCSFPVTTETTTPGFANKTRLESIFAISFGNLLLYSEACLSILKLSKVAKLCQKEFFVLFKGKQNLSYLGLARKRHQENIFMKMREKWWG